MSATITANAHPRLVSRRSASWAAGALVFTLTIAAFPAAAFAALDAMSSASQTFSSRSSLPPGSELGKTSRQGTPTQGNGVLQKDSVLGTG